MTTQTIERTIQAWTSDPSKARGLPTVKAHSSGHEITVEAGAFKWTADLPPSLGGQNAAPSPTVLMLSSLAACAAGFIEKTLAPLAGVRVDGVLATASCAADSRGLLGLDGVAPDLQNMNLEIEIESPDGVDAVERLAALWKERCPIFLALIKPMQVHVSIKALDWYKP